MGVILSSTPLALESGKTVNSSEFNVTGATRDQIVVIFVVRNLTAPARFDIKLENKSGSAWNVAGPLMTSTIELMNGVHYARLPQAQGTVRLSIASSSPGHIDVFASDRAPSTPWASGAHRLDALGTTVAAEIPSLQLGLELALIGALTAMTRATPDGGTPVPERTAKTGTLLPASLFEYLLGNRIDHANVPPSAIQRIASSVNMTEAQLRDHVDHLNALSDVALELTVRGASQGSAGVVGLTICGFWSHHIDPGPCQSNPQGDINGVCTVTDVTDCNTLDIHY
jgi:hypothetical protein